MWLVLAWDFKYISFSWHIFQQYDGTGVMLLGPVCVSYSLMGKKLGEKDAAFLTHKAYYEQAPKVADVILVENVTEYPPETVSTHLGPEFTLNFCKIDPRLFGLPASRARIFLIAYRHSVVRWRPDVSLDSVLGALVSRVVSTADMYFWMKLPKSILTAAQETWLWVQRVIFFGGQVKNNVFTWGFPLRLKNGTIATWKVLFIFN